MASYPCEVCVSYELSTYPPVFHTSLGSPVKGAAVLIRCTGSDWALKFLANEGGGVDGGSDGILAIFVFDTR